MSVKADGTPVPPALAVLCRRRAQMETISRELEARGIPYEIVGLGGLLDTPEIVDLVSTLRVLADPGTVGFPDAPPRRRPVADRPG